MKFIFKNLPSEVGGIRENSECIQLKRYKRQSDFLICSLAVRDYQTKNLHIHLSLQDLDISRSYEGMCSFKPP